MRKCPNLVLVKPHYELYEKSSKAFIAILRKYSDLVEQHSIDEAFVDMTGTKMLFGEPVVAANRIKDEIYQTLGFTVNVGVSSNKLLAKMASDFKKPNLVHTLLTSYLKKQGETIWNFANGKDFTIVDSEPSALKGYGNSTTLAFDVTDSDTAKIVLLSLAETIGRRLRNDDVKIEVVSVNMRFTNLSFVSHQSVLENATCITSEIYLKACALFDEMWDGTPIRLLGIQTARISKEENCRQISFFDSMNYERLERLDQAMDKIRRSLII